MKIFTEFLFSKNKALWNPALEKLIEGSYKTKGYVLENNENLGCILPKGNSVNVYLMNQEENWNAYPINRKEFGEIYPEKHGGVIPSLNYEMRYHKPNGEDVFAILHESQDYILRKHGNTWEGGPAKKFIVPPPKITYVLD